MSFLIYGAYGYTGALIAREAEARGLTPTLAGRDADQLDALAGELDLPCRAFALDDRAALSDAVAEADLVLNCAGPFARTAQPVVEACLRGGAHYLDITGEIAVFEQIAAQDSRAKAAGVMLMPGVGFDVVPTDCLAAHLHRQQPDTAYLELAIFGVGGVSRGTARTAALNAGRGGAIRTGGRIRRVPAAWRTRRVDFGRGPTEVVSIPWGDVATAWRTTGIPTIVTYAKLPDTAVRAMRLSRYVGPLLRTRPAQAFLETLVKERIPGGPDAQTREKGRSFVWGKASTKGGRAAKARLRGPETYALTVQTALAATERTLQGDDAAPGYQTPAGRFGADFILEIDGTHREDLA
jgi:short subunit dehydrogenase-like uncharacterized protein